MATRFLASFTSGFGGSGPWPAWLALLFHRAEQHAAWRSVRGALRSASEHTGLPIVVVGAIALVVGWRIAKRSAHIAVELAVALALLVVATKLGWIRW